MLVKFGSPTPLTCGLCIASIKTATGFARLSCFSVLIFEDLAFRFVKAATLGPLSNNRTRWRN